MINKMKRKSGKHFCFTTASNNGKYLRATITKEVKDLYNKSCKTL